MAKLAERRAEHRMWRFPAGRVGYAIGDVHGCADLLRRLLELIAADAARSDLEPFLVFLGDYVDRGPDSRGVIELLSSGELGGVEARFLRGNHEQAMLAFLESPSVNVPWLSLGGLQTVVSYGIAASHAGASPDSAVRVAEGLRQAVPPRHLAFLKGLERYATYDDYLFVHAGVDPAKALQDQTDTDLYWIRKRFLEAKGVFSHCVVHGHTPSTAPYLDDRRIAVDTGAYAFGTLTAVRIEANRTSFITASASS